MWVERMAVRGGGGHYSVTFIFRNSENLKTPLKGHGNGYISIMESHGKVMEKFLNLCGNPAYELFELFVMELKFLVRN